MREHWRQILWPTIGLGSVLIVLACAAADPLGEYVPEWFREAWAGMVWWAISFVFCGVLLMACTAIYWLASAWTRR